ncbi:uncharacterized protein LOC120359209 isoform X2 [Solenopsis invicta]|uniref:uncharacterized protein LOC120359209 isoform X2 n=1 Tax=Solenopsis invicta TaxID=13686 RepID=UPI00193CA93F|nr:uncharacterized protein LOC120359209 isoform X2 [Solenopsis invicta]XP_039311918.1 uncharacterized protein LOC120359209 isoform X2 [Solenopsis invicta]
MINKDYIMLFFNMSFSEKTDSEVMRKNYTDRHKRRLAHKKSTNEFKRICNKIKQNRTCNTSANNNNDQIDLLFGNSCTDMENTYLQHTDNIYVQVPAENCDELINEETFNNYSTSIETEIQSENQENLKQPYDEQRRLLAVRMSLANQHRGSLEHYKTLKFKAVLW